MSWSSNGPGPALQWNDQGRPIVTARMQEDGKIGRMAVLEPWRGRGVGRTLFVELLAEAKRRGLSQVYLAAQTHAIGHIFLDAGIPHRAITMKLPK